MIIDSVVNRGVQQTVKYSFFITKKQQVNWELQRNNAWCNNIYDGISIEIVSKLKDQIIIEAHNEVLDIVIGKIRQVVQNCQET